MATRISFGVNMSFAKYVYGPRHALEVVRNDLQLRHAEMVADNDFGPTFYQQSPEAFRAYHWQVASHARALGVTIPSVFTVYRDAGGIAASQPEIRESAYLVGRSILEQAACYRARWVGASLFTMNREVAEDPERYQARFYDSMEIWKRWMTDAKRLGIEGLVVEMAAAYREGCSTIEDTRVTLDLLGEYHENNPDTTVPVALCYDTGHGVSRQESQDDADRDFHAWLQAFADRTVEIHLKDTDPDFIETWHFGESGDERPRSIDLYKVLADVRDTLTVPEVCIYIEVPGKRGRRVGEERALEEHRASIAEVETALSRLGYQRSEVDGSWALENDAAG